MGYTLSGFYLVKGNDTVGQFRVVFCEFQLPQGANRSKDIVQTNKYGINTGIDYVLF